jgi:hypothetical protein
MASECTACSSQGKQLVNNPPGVAPAQYCGFASIAGCREMSKEVSECLECFDGFYLEDGVCVDCNLPNCMSCETDKGEGWGGVQTFTTCSDCATNFTLVAGWADEWEEIPRQ